MTSDSVRTYIIAEVGVNHNGSVELAKKLIDVANEAKADAVKFQTWKAQNVVSRVAPKAEYQVKNTGNLGSQLDMLKGLELSEEAQASLVDYCANKGIDFLSSPFDEEALQVVVHHFRVPAIKIPSGEIVNAPLLIKAAQTGKPIILSTGMSSLSEVEQSMAILAFGYLNMGVPSMPAFAKAYATKEAQALLKKNVTLLHCTTEYPAPFAEVNLRAMDTLREKFDVTVGLSDHTPGIVVPLAAVARGAKVIEKHFTLDRNLPGPDHKASLVPDELKMMVAGIRVVEEALGDGQKRPAPSEVKNIPIARKSLIARQKIVKGEVFTEKNLTCKRPGTGISPMLYWQYLGQRAKYDYEEDELVKE